MKRSLRGLVTGVMIAIVGSGTWWFFHESRTISKDESATADKAESSQGPIAPVKVVPRQKRNSGRRDHCLRLDRTRGRCRANHHGAV